MTLASDQEIGTADLSDKSHRVLAMREEVFTEWARRVRRLVPGADRVEAPVLINTLPAFYDNIAAALTPGVPRDGGPVNATIAAIATAHGSERARMTGYGPGELIHEYQLFRETFTQIAAKKGIALDGADWQVVNASIDLAVRQSLAEFTARHMDFRTRVAAALTHDMRTPLSVITNGAQLLALSPGAEQAALVAPKIQASARRLDEMIRELLDALSFHRGGKLPLVVSCFDALALAREVCDQINDAGPTRCVASGTSVVGHWCRNSLRRAIENLVTNGIKYGNAEPIRVKVEAAHDRMILSVHNSGNPIPPEQTSRIFAYLRRESDSGTVGWGIGLPFVQSVAESHGGSVAVDSSAEAGTTFLLDLPRDSRPFGAPPAVP